MKKIKLYEEFMSDLVNEKKTTYDYGCAMIYFEFPEMESLHKQIDKEDVFVDPNDSTFGLETEPHCTLLYGLHADVAVNTVKKIVDNFDFGECTIEGASLFENEKFDVLKFDVTGSGLHDCNAALVKLPHTTDYPNYHPHMTIAYLKNGMGKKYVDLLGTEKRTLKPSYIVYSQPDGTKSKIDL